MSDITDKIKNMYTYVHHIDLGQRWIFFSYLTTDQPKNRLEKWHIYIYIYKQQSNQHKKGKQILKEKQN